MNGRMKGLDTSTEHLRGLGDISHVPDSQPRVTQLLGGASTGNESKPMLLQAPGKVNQAGLVRHRQKGCSFPKKNKKNDGE